MNCIDSLLIEWKYFVYVVKHDTSYIMLTLIQYLKYINPTLFQATMYVNEVNFQTSFLTKTFIFMKQDFQIRQRK